MIAGLIICGWTVPAVVLLLSCRFPPIPRSGVLEKYPFGRIRHSLSNHCPWSMNAPCSLLITFIEN